MNIFKKILLCSAFVFLSGCTFIDDITQKKDEIQSQYQDIKNNTLESIDEVQNKIEETQKNISQKQEEFNQKVQEIKEAKAAFDKVFGNDEKQKLQAEISQLEKEKQEISETSIVLNKAEEKLEEEKLLQEKKDDNSFQEWLKTNHYNKEKDVIKRNTNNEISIYREVAKKAF